MEKNINKKSRKLEAILWSIALPGFGQLLNRKYVKGLFLVILEIIVNVLGNFNRVIVLSFNMEIDRAIAETNYLWLMFYPCLYFFSIWDAYKDAGGGKTAYAYLPLVFSAYFVTVGLIFSARLTLFGYLVGPMWLPILFLPIGLTVGAVVRWILLKMDKDESEKTP
jgi:hypothetical protein